MAGHLRKLREDERGLFLVFAGLGFMGFLICATLAIDVGMFMNARSEAQNSADAGALAGAVAMVFDNYADRSSTGPAVQNAVEFARSNQVMSQDVSVTTADVTFPTQERIRVDVYRDRGPRQPAHDADRRNLRDPDGRRHGHGDGGGGTGRRGHVPSAVGGTRQVGRDANPTVGSEHRRDQHVRRERAEPRRSPRRPGHLQPGRQRPIHRLRPPPSGTGLRAPGSPQAGQPQPVDQPRPLLPACAPRRQRGGLVRAEHRRPAGPVWVRSVT